MLDGIYTKDQLYSLFHSSDLSNIKKTLTRQGYIIKSNNKRGKDYRLSVTVNNKIVNSVIFRNFCKEQFNIQNIDYQTFAIFVYFFLCDDYFSCLTFEEQVIYLREEGYYTSRQTLAKYLDILKSKYLVVDGDFEYYFYLDGTRTKTTKAEYQEAWDYYHTRKYEISDCKRAFAEMVTKYGGKPCRRRSVIKGNALLDKEYNSLIEAAANSYQELVRNGAIYNNTHKV